MGTLHRETTVVRPYLTDDQVSETAVTAEER